MRSLILYVDKFQDAFWFLHSEYTIFFKGEISNRLISGPAERFLSHRDFTLIHLLKPPGLLSNTYFEACENCQILKNHRDQSRQSPPFHRACIGQHFWAFITPGSRPASKASPYHTCRVMLLPQGHKQPFQRA